MRAFLTVALTAALVSSGWAQAPEYFPLKPGTRKSYQATVNQATSVAGQSAMSLTLYFRNTEEVVGASKAFDKPAVLVRTTRRDSTVGKAIDETKPALRIDNYYQTRPQGVFLLANFTLPSDSTQKSDSARYEPGLQLLKLPPDTAAGWKVGRMKMQGILVDLSARVLGREDVEVPGGSFKNCLKVKSSSDSISGNLQGSTRLAMTVTGGEFSSTSWYAPGVGLVKQEVSTRFEMSSPNLPPGMKAELNFQQHVALSKLESAPPASNKVTKKK